MVVGNVHSCGWPEGSGQPQLWTVKSLGGWAALPVCLSSGREELRIVECKWSIPPCMVMVIIWIGRLGRCKPFVA
eukprot:scaffold2765_cov165-Amphora_coffeaeformis.AAC.18